MTELIHGDCLEVLRAMPDCSVDAVVTDPPYGLSFMGKKWDYDVPGVEVWAECLRVLKPGGHLLAFAGTRTQHRMAVRIEDAGFEIRDMIAWVYGSGFPKSLDVSKAIDKHGRGAMVREKLKRFAALRGIDGKWLEEHGVASAASFRDWTDGGHVPSDKNWQLVRAALGVTPEEEAAFEREVVGKAAWKTLNEAPMVGADCSAENRSFKDITAPATPEAKQWQGWGTALKPALEPITVARKPLIGTVAENVLQHGTGAINVDGGRVGTDPAVDDPRLGGKGTWKTDKAAQNVYEGGYAGQEVASSALGRWPANFIHDGSEEATDLLKDSARFFYCAKASKADRDVGCEGIDARFAPTMGNGIGGKEHDPVTATPKHNHHPTVKPTDLMRYLCRLVTPLNGVVLDPFMGSGSTGKAAALEGFSFIGIEREAEYVAIAQARINHVTND